MPDDGFGSGLWKNVQSIKFGRDGGIEVPVRANGSDGIQVGLEEIAQGRTSSEDSAPARRSWRRFFRR